MVVHVLLGRDGDAIAGGRSKAPILQGFEHFAVDRRGQTLNYDFLNNVAFFIDRDLDHDIALQPVQLDGSDGWVRRDHGQSRADFFSGQWPVQNRAQRRTCGVNLGRFSGHTGFGIGSKLRSGQLALGLLRRLGVLFPGEVRIQLLLRGIVGGTRRNIGRDQAALIRPIEMGHLGSVIAVHDEGWGNDPGTGYVQEPQEEQTVKPRRDAERGWSILTIAGLKLAKHRGELHLV